MLHLAAIVLCIVFWPVTLAVLVGMMILYILKILALTALGIGFAIFYPSQHFSSTVNTCCHPGDVTSVQGQMFFFWMLGLLGFCAIMAYRQSKESK